MSSDCIDTIRKNARDSISDLQRLLHGINDLEGIVTRSQSAKMNRIQELTTQNEVLTAENEKYRSMVAETAHARHLAEAQLAMTKSENCRLTGRISELLPHARACSYCRYIGHDVRTCTKKWKDSPS